MVREMVGTDVDADAWLDVEQFRKLVRAWQEHGHPESELCPRCLPALAEAVELYRGDFLAGFTLRDSVNFDDWQFFQAEGLRQELASALERLLRGHSALGAYQSAIPYARRWVALDPLHEPAQRELMRVYAQAGQRAAAVRQYAECQRVLELELGVSPEEETTLLFQAIKARRNVSGEAAPGLPQPVERRYSLPVQRTEYVQREAMLTEIDDRLRGLNRGQLAPVDPVGSGKTRLAPQAGADILSEAQLPNYEDGVFFVSLAPSQSLESIEPAAAPVFGISPPGTDAPRQQLRRHLRERALLLILDNFGDLLSPEPVPSDVEGSRERGGGGTRIRGSQSCSGPQDPGQFARGPVGVWRASLAGDRNGCPERPIDTCGCASRCRSTPCCPAVRSRCAPGPACF